MHYNKGCCEETELAQILGSQVFPQLGTALGKEKQKRVTKELLCQEVFLDLLAVMAKPYQLPQSLAFTMDSGFLLCRSRLSCYHSP